MYRDEELKEVGWHPDQHCSSGGVRGCEDCRDDAEVKLKELIEQALDEKPDWDFYWEKPL